MQITSLSTYHRPLLNATISFSQCSQYTEYIFNRWAFAGRLHRELRRFTVREYYAPTMNPPWDNSGAFQVHTKLHKSFISRVLLPTLFHPLFHTFLSLAAFAIHLSDTENVFFSVTTHPVSKCDFKTGSDVAQIVIRISLQSHFRLQIFSFQPIVMSYRSNLRFRNWIFYLKRLCTGICHYWLRN